MKHKRKTIIGLVVSALFLILIFYNVDCKEIISTFRDFNLKNLSAIVAMFAFTMIIRAYRWSLLLQADKRFSFYSLTSSWVIGNLMNAFLPARAGDIWRAYKVGGDVKESKMKLFGSIMLERILDGVSVCFILYFCIVTYANLTWLRHLADISALLFGGSLIGVYLIVRFNKISDICELLETLSYKMPEIIKEWVHNIVLSICHHVKLFVSGFEVLKSNYYVFQSVLMSFAIWVVECLITYWVIISFGTKYPISAAMFVICFVALGSMLPSSSIFVGPYQYAYILALGIYFVPKSEALAIAFVHQSILMGALIVFSAVCCLINFMGLFRHSKVQAVEDSLPQEVLQETHT